jgi:hypothetical protein
MDDPIATQIATAVTSGGLELSWPFYVFWSLIAVLGSFCGSYVSSYARKHAETIATKDDLKEILAQLKATTRTTEEIRSEISHSDWRQREWKATRRAKLEELLTAANSINGYLERERSSLIFSKQVDELPDPLDKISMLCSLYFGELEVKAGELAEASRSAHSCIIKHASFLGKLGPSQAGTVPWNLAQDKFREAWGEKYLEFRRKLSSLEKEAGIIMKREFAT